MQQCSAAHLGGRCVCCSRVRGGEAELGHVRRQVARVPPLLLLVSSLFFFPLLLISSTCLFPLLLVSPFPLFPLLLISPVLFFPPLLVSSLLLIPPLLISSLPLLALVLVSSLLLPVLVVSPLVTSCNTPCYHDTSETANFIYPQVAILTYLQFIQGGGVVRVHSAH